MPRRTISLRWGLLRGLLVLIVLLSGAILFVIRAGVRDTVDTVVRQFTSALADQTEFRIRRFHDQVEAELDTVAGWARSGALRCTDLDCLDPLIRPVMDRLPRISGISTANEAGEGIMMMRTPTGWIQREVHADAWGDTARWRTLERDGGVLREWRDEAGYDPRTRPWYLPPETAGPAWTSPYSFFTTGAPGITASRRVVDAIGTSFVVAYDVELDEISSYTTSIAVGRSGFAVVVDEEGRALGLPRDPRYRDPGQRREALLQRVRDLGLEGPRDLAHAVRSREPARGEPFSFDSGGRVWWGEWRTIQLDADTSLYLGIGVPVTDYMGAASRNRIYVVTLSLVALLLAGFAALRFARRFAAPLEDLTEQSARLERLDTSPTPPQPTRIRELARLRGSQERMRQALDSFARYVPTDVVRDLLARGEAAKIGGREVEVTVLFTDVRGFTRIAERMSPAELVRHMSEYFELVTGTLKDGGATIDKLVGDAVVAFWGAPRPNPHHARDAVAAVQRCREALGQLNARWAEEGKFPLPTRFGLATGPVVVGNVGAPSRLHYTALGDTMNLASRLESENAVHGTELLADRSTVVAAGGDWPWEEIGPLTVKGREAPTTAYTLR